MLGARGCLVWQSDMEVILRLDSVTTMHVNTLRKTTGASGNRPSHTQNRVHYVTALPGSGKPNLLYRHAGSPTTFACHVIGGEVNRWSSGQYRAMIHGIRGKFGVLGNV